MKITDPQLQEQIKEFARLSDEIDVVKNKLKELETQYGSIEDIIRPVLEQLDETEDRALEVGNILITIKKKGYERTSYAYKEAFEWLKKRVNPIMRKLVEEVLEQTKKIAKISSSIGVQKLEENKILDAIKSFFSNWASKLSNYNKQLDSNIDEFKSRIK